MRWERLFAELEAEAADLASEDREAEIADRTRAELGRVHWADRVRAAGVGQARLRLVDGALLVGLVRQVGAGWLLVETAAHEVLVAAPAVAGIEGLGSAVAPGPDVVRLTWSSAWRVLARDRADVRIVRVGAGAVQGVPVRVGADFVEIDSAAGSGSVIVPYAAIIAGYVARQPMD